VVTDFSVGEDHIRLDDMRLVKAREVDTDADGVVDATSLQFNGASVTLLEVTGLTSTDQLFIF
jgi:hypothetical protein